MIKIKENEMENIGLFFRSIQMLARSVLFLYSLRKISQYYWKLKQFRDFGCRINIILWYSSSKWGGGDMQLGNCI